MSHTTLTRPGIISRSWERTLMGGGLGAGAWDSSSVEPPSPANIHFWYDGSDVASLYSDDEATILISGADEDVVRAIKAQPEAADQAVLTTGAADTDVEFILAYQNSLGGIEFAPSTSDITADALAAMTNSEHTVMHVFSADETSDGAFSFHREASAAGNAEWGARIGGGELIGIVEGLSSVDTEGVVADGIVVALVYTVEHETQSGIWTCTAEVSDGTWTEASAWTVGALPFAIGDDLTINLANQGMNFGEVIVWEGIHDISQISQYVANKWALTFGA